MAAPSGTGTATPTATPTGTPSPTSTSLTETATPTQTQGPTPSATTMQSPTATTTPTATPPPTTTSEPAAPPLLERGDEGPPVLAVQERLASLGYWVGPQDGDFGHLTEQAVLALQGAAGLARDGVVGPRTRAALEDGVVPDPRSDDGHVVEIDRDSGLLVVADDGKASLVLHTSTGTFEPYVYEGRELLADTPGGEWEVTWAVDGWRDGALGRLYRPRYFHRDGIAVHGYPSVPAYPASHGCARVSIAAMDMIWQRDLMPIGSTVLVY